MISGPNGVGILPNGNGRAPSWPANSTSPPSSTGARPPAPKARSSSKGAHCSYRAMPSGFFQPTVVLQRIDGGLTPPPSSQLRLDFVNAAPLINILGNSTSIGANSYMLNDTGVQLPITIAPNVTLTSSIGFGERRHFCDQSLSVSRDRRRHAVPDWEWSQLCNGHGHPGSAAGGQLHAASIHRY